MIVEKVETEKYKRALRAAVESRNGWKQILAICAPKPLPTQKEIIRRTVEAYMARRDSK